MCFVPIFKSPFGGNSTPPSKKVALSYFLAQHVEVQFGPQAVVPSFITVVINPLFSIIVMICVSVINVGS